MAHIWGDCGIAYGPNSLWSSGGYGWSHAELVWGLLGAYWHGFVIRSLVNTLSLVHAAQGWAPSIFQSSTLTHSTFAPKRRIETFARDLERAQLVRLKAERLHGE